MTSPNWVQTYLARKCICEHFAEPPNYTASVHEFLVDISGRGVQATKDAAIAELAKQICHARNIWFRVPPATTCLNGMTSIRMRGKAW
jgi:hypothetical protein